MIKIWAWIGKQRLEKVIPIEMLPEIDLTFSVSSGIMWGIEKLTEEKEQN